MTISSHRELGEKSGHPNTKNPCKRENFGRLAQLGEHQIIPTLRSTKPVPTPTLGTLRCVRQASNHDVIEAYFAYLTRKRKADNTIKRYRPELRRYAEWLGEEPFWSVRAREIENGFLMEWERDFIERNDRRPSASAQRGTIQALISFYDFCDRFEYLEDADGNPVRNPMRSIEMPKIERKAIQWLNREEDRAMIDCVMDARERVLVHLLRFTGIRLDEALTLTNADIDLVGKLVRVRCSKSDAGLGREIPLNPELIPALQDWIAYTQEMGWYYLNGPFLITRNGTAMKPQYVELVVKRIALRAEVREGAVTPHTLRRTFGSDLLNRNPPVRLEVVSKLLGHASTAITEKAYAQLLNETIRREMMAALTR